MWQLLKEIAFKILGLGGELPSPKVRVSEGDLIYLETTKTVEVRNILPKVTFFTVADTHSMEPLIDKGFIQIGSSNPEYINNVEIGDIIVWQKYVQWGKAIQLKRIMHKIVEIGNDGEWFCKTKGINCLRRDPWKIRRKDIQLVWRGEIV